MMRNLFFLMLCLLLPFASDAEDKQKKQEKQVFRCDGPYIFHDSIGGARIVNVTRKGKLVDQHVAELPAGYTFEVRSENGKHHFNVSLHEVSRPQSVYPDASRVYVISDPHANFDCFHSILKAGGVIDNACNWTFGDGHLVICGDVMDRGVDATTIFWLIYKLEAEAKAAGGTVSFILGNHEPLVLMNDVRYTNKKYKDLAQALGIETNQLYGRNTELGRWLTTRNTIMRIGRNLFVHAGLSPDLYRWNLPMDTINAEVSRGLYLKKKERQALSDRVYFLHASTGPIWYRGLVSLEDRYFPSTPDSLQMILDRYGADRLYVGHTIFSQVSTFFKKKVIDVNVDNKEARKEGRTRAVMIEDGKAILYNDKGSTKKEL